MVGVAQLVEHKVVALVVAGSSPVAHPNLKKGKTACWAVFPVFTDVILRP